MWSSHTWLWREPNSVGALLGDVQSDAAFKKSLGVGLQSSLGPCSRLVCGSVLTGSCSVSLWRIDPFPSSPTSVASPQHLVLGRNEESRMPRFLPLQATTLTPRPLCSFSHRTPQWRGMCPTGYFPWFLCTLSPDLHLGSL